MQRVLFHSTIFGPIKSRRLGTSLGVNLSPDDGKICSFDCLYCEAGFNAQGAGTTGFPSRQKVVDALNAKLHSMRRNSEPLDVITFSGNGEPTLHPQFPEIVDDVIEARDKYYPQAKISVLTNSTMLHSTPVVEALKKVDNPILKLDSAIDDTIRLLDRPNSPGFTFSKVQKQLKDFGSRAIVQTMILRGTCDGKTIDNTSTAEVDALINAIKDINPRGVMLYSIDRPTPHSELQKVCREELETIAEAMRRAGIKDVTVN